MNKAWLVSSLLGIVTLGVIGATSFHRNADYRFLDGADPVASKDIVLKTNLPTHVEMFNLHVPFDDAWAQAQVELCDHDGWKLGTRSFDSQNFNLNGAATVSLVKGKVDAQQEFVPGTETTDTYVVVRRRKR